MDAFSITPEYSIETVSRNFKMSSMHYHESYELYYLEVGTRDYFVEDKLFSVSPGEFVLIPPGKLHRTGGEYCVRTLVHFTKAFLLRIFTEDVTKKILRCFENVRVSVNHEQRPIIKLLLENLHSAASDREFAMILALLLEELGKCGTQDIQYGKLGAVVAFINDNYANIQNIEQVANHFYISKYHLCRKFKDAMHVTLIDYLNQVRLKNAKQLLEITDNEVGQIAQQCGYNSAAYFSSIFRKNTGQSPSDYRKLTKH